MAELRFLFGSSLFLLILSVFSLESTLASSRDLQCFIPGECTNGQLLSVQPSVNEYKCLDLCQLNRNCAWFSFNPDSGSCLLFSSCLNFDETLCPACVSGQKECTIPEPVCQAEGFCIGNVTHTEYNIRNKKECLRSCHSYSDCSWFSYFPDISTCVLFRDCPTLNTNCQSCTSGESSCKIAFTKILVGVGNSDKLSIDNIEIIDLESPDTNCSNLPNFPIKVEGSIGSLWTNNTPIICGGDDFSDQEKSCHIFENNAWTTFPDMLTKRRASAVTLSPYPNETHRLMLTGMDTNYDYSNSGEILTDDGWHQMEHPLPDGIFNHCMVLVNRTTVLVIGGTQGPIYYSANTFFFNTEDEKWVPGPRLINGRRTMGCGKVRMEEGSSQYTIVVAAGQGDSGYYLDSELLDNGALEWRKGPNLKYQMREASLVEDSNGGVILIGGSSYDIRDLNTLFHLPHAKAEWIELPQKLKIPRSNAVAFLVPDEITNCV